jgi:spermidine/putrescine-binding protein
VQALADACAPGETDGDLNLANWTEYTPTGILSEEAEVKDLLAGFEEEYGVNATLTEYDSNETMLAQVSAGVAYDVVVPSDYMVSIMKDADLLVKFNQAVIPNLDANIADLFKETSYDPGNEYSAPYQWGTTGIGYKYGEIDDENGVSWAVIFDADVSAANAGVEVPRVLAEHDGRGRGRRGGTVDLRYQGTARSVQLDLILDVADNRRDGRGSRLERRFLGRVRQHLDVGRQRRTHL